MQNETYVVFNSIVLTPEELEQCIKDTCKLSSFSYMYTKIICNPNYHSNISAVKLVVNDKEYLEELIYQVTTDIKFAENMEREN